MSQQQPVIPQAQVQGQIVILEGRQFNCEDFRLPTMNKTSFYKALKGSQGQKSIFTEEQLNKQLEAIYNKCFSATTPSVTVLGQKPDDINNKDIKEMLVKIGEDQKNIDQLSKLPVKTSDSNIIVDPSGPSTVFNPKSTTTVTIEKSTNTQSSQVPIKPISSNTTQ